MEAEFINTLPPNVGRVLTGFIEQAKSDFANDLRAVVLYGSGAEGKLRPTSDVNLLLLLSAFDEKRADQLREPLRLAQAAIGLKTMFLLESELRPAMAAFAVKFADIMRRRRVLYGDDPFAGVSISRTDSIARLKQTLMKARAQNSSPIRTARLRKPGSRSRRLKMSRGLIASDLTCFRRALNENGRRHLET